MERKAYPGDFSKRRERGEAGFEAPVAYDGHVDGHGVSVMMNQFGTGGTPWSFIIDQKGVVRLSGFTPEAERMEPLIRELRN